MIFEYLPWRDVAGYLGAREAENSVMQGVALAQVLGLQLAVGQVAQAGALQVRLHQAEGAAVARDQLQRLPDAIHLHRGEHNIS